MTELKDIDGTEPGKAALLGVSLGVHSVEVHTKDLYNESEYPDPLSTAMKIKKSVEEDHPNWIFTIAANDRANYLRWEYLMKRVIGGEHTPEHYLAVL